MGNLARCDKEGEMAGLEMKYFVLNPNTNDRYGRASRNAIRTYAIDIETEDPQLANDLVNWLALIEEKLG